VLDQCREPVVVSDAAAGTSADPRPV